MTVFQEKIKAVLFGIYSKNKEESILSMKELEALAAGNGIEVVHSFLQSIEKPTPKYYIGSGKVEELQNFILQHGCHLAICDNELSSSQVRNLKKKVKCDVIDRSELILDIFESKAQTKEAKVRVEIAKLKYEMSKLRHLWTHFSRIQGGGGATKGMGETQLEVDRRRNRERIYRLEKQLKDILRHKDVSMKKRNSFFKVVFVGYTNAGKSTLMNALSSKAAVLSENKMFSTIHTTTRRVDIDLSHSFIVSDTVGFVRKLPKHLLDSFYATLMEVKEADLLLHVVDASSQGYNRSINILNDILAYTLGKNNKKIFLIFNKIDCLKSLLEEEILSQIPSNDQIKTIFVSAKNGEGISTLKNEIVKEMDQDRLVKTIKIPFSQKQKYAFIYKNAQILEETYFENGIIFHIRIGSREWNALNKMSDNGS